MWNTVYNFIYRSVASIQKKWYDMKKAISNYRDKGINKSGAARDDGGPTPPYTKQIERIISSCGKTTGTGIAHKWMKFIRIIPFKLIW